jgi:hypothetical protein
MAKYTVEELVEEMRVCDIFKTNLPSAFLEAIARKLRAGEKLAEAAIKVMGDLGLNDDPAFAGLGKAVDEYEEA